MHVLLFNRFGQLLWFDCLLGLHAYHDKIIVSALFYKRPNKFIFYSTQITLFDTQVLYTAISKDFRTAKIVYSELRKKGEKYEYLILSDNTCKEYFEKNNCQ